MGGRTTRDRRRPGAMIVANRRGIGPALLVAAIYLAPTALYGEVFRCTAADGSIEFRQYPCHERDTSLRIDIDDSPTGWTPPASKASPPAKKKPLPTKPAMIEQDEAVVDRCWKKQRQLDDVNRRLRAGYTASQGVRLRQRRGDYEAYIRRFCD